jgi:peptide/nickel transport system permease protein
MWIRAIARQIPVIALTVLLGGLLGATLVRLAPGFDVDERQLDSRLSQQSQAAIQQERASESNILVFYARYLGGLLRGDLGTSRALGRPVAELIRARLPVTLRALLMGLLAGWFLALALSLPAVLRRSRCYELVCAFASGLPLSLPSGVLALLLFYMGGPVGLAIALVVFPKVFRYLRNLFLEASELPHVLSARARGISEARILVWHVLYAVAPQVVALAGVSVSLALGAAVPIEVLLDSPGIGQLAWQAALGRDLPVLVNLTLFVTLLTLMANSSADVVGRVLSPRVEMR